MSEPTGRGYKTIAVRLPDDEHAQLVLIAALEEQSLNDTLRQAVLALIEVKRAGGDLAAQAAKALAEMEQEAASKRAALQALLGPSGDETGQQALTASPTETGPAPTRGRPRRTS
jgi:hypothetical protein